MAILMIWPLNNVKESTSNVGLASDYHQRLKTISNIDIDFDGGGGRGNNCVIAPPLPLFFH